MRKSLPLFLMLPGCIFITRFPFPVCGNGIHEFSANQEKNEECDDGNDVNLDGCDKECNLELCGNNQPNDGEQCDDGNLTDGDGCDSDCTNTACGNGILTDGEACDDNNTNNGDGCDAACQVEPPEGCGDNNVQAPEECDDGNVISGDGCNAACIDEFCGDNAVNDNGSEACDNGAANSDTQPDACRTNCQNPRCGDGVTDTGEDCDDANQDNDDACSNACQALIVGCGDGALDIVAEECDDGNVNTNDGCDNICQLEADLFVNCGLAAGANNGSLTDPFQSLAAAVAAAPANARIMILPQSTASCNEATINKSLSLYGFADSANPPANIPTIDGGAEPAITVSGNAELTVAFQGLVLRSNDDGVNTVNLTANSLNGTKIGFSQVDVQNTAASGAAISCNTLAADLLVDRSFIHDSATGISSSAGCSVYVTNSLFLNLSTALNLNAATFTTIEVFYAVFDQISTKTASCSGQSLFNKKIDSSIFNNINGTTAPTGCTVSSSDTFGSNTAGNNINLDPNFISSGVGPFADYHLGGNSPCKDSANPSPGFGLFNPVSTFSSLNAPIDFDVLRHDAFGKPRPVNQPDMGLSEE